MGEIKKRVSVYTSKLKPYTNNAKLHSREQIDAIKKSIEEFGFLAPVLIDKEYNVIAGHGRIMAAEELEMKKIPCIMIEGLTEAQRKAYILADNRLSEMGGGWDDELILSELEFLEDSNFDSFLTGFDIEDFQLDDSDFDDGYYGDERERTNDAYNLGIAHDTVMTNDFWQMPVINNDGFIPENLIGFNYAKSSKDKETGIHFFIDDYQFERIWNYPDKYIEILSKYQCILSPDFSLYMDMPMPMKIWNIYRSRQIGAYYQGCGIKVIPTISWAEPETFQFCFCGIPKGSIVAVSTIGVKKKEESMDIWKAGMDEMIKQIEPETILVYGGKLKYNYGKIKTVYFDNKVTKNWQKGTD